MKNFFKITLAILVLLLSACQSNDNESTGSKPELTISETPLQFITLGESHTLAVEVTNGIGYHIDAATTNNHFECQVSGLDVIVTAPKNDTGNTITGELVVVLANAKGNAAVTKRIQLTQEYNISLGMLHDYITTNGSGTSLNAFAGIEFEGWIAVVPSDKVNLLSVVDNLQNPTTQLFLYANKKEEYVAGKKISFSLSENSAVNTLYNSALTATSVTIAVQTASESVTVHEATVAEVNNGSVDNQYVCVKGLTAKIPFEKWENQSTRTFTNAANESLSLYVPAALNDDKYITDLSGDAYGLVLNSKLMPMSYTDVAALSCDPYQGDISISTTTDIKEGTYYLVVNNDIENAYYYATSSYKKPKIATAKATINQRTGEIIIPTSAQIVKFWKAYNSNDCFYLQFGSKFYVATGKSNGLTRMVNAGSVAWSIRQYDSFWYFNTTGGWPQDIFGATDANNTDGACIYATSSIASSPTQKLQILFQPVTTTAYDSYTHPEKQAPLTLPYTLAGKGLFDILDMPSIWSYNLGQDYSGDTYKLKFGEDADRGASSLTLHVDSAVDAVTLQVKMTGGSNDSSFTVLGSADNIDYTEVDTLNISGAQNSTLELTTTQAFDATYRYIRISFNKGSNVGLESLKITKKAN